MSVSFKLKFPCIETPALEHNADLLATLLTLLLDNSKYDKEKGPECWCNPNQTH